jgi:ketosteroid isomerase-like protein
MNLMGPRVEACICFVTTSGQPAAIGALADAALTRRLADFSGQSRVTMRFGNDEVRVPASPIIASTKERVMAQTEQAATPGEVAAAYFRAWTAGDIDSVRPLLHPDVDFRGAMGATHGTDETMQGLAGMFAMTRHVEVIRRWTDGPDVITWFELSTGTAGPLPVVNWSHVEDGRITRIRVTFDPRPLLG